TALSIARQIRYESSAQNSPPNNAPYRFVRCLSSKKAREWAKGWPYAGYKMTIFSASEEKWVENDILHAKMYFNMPYALTTAEGEVATGKDFEPNVIADRELITGQNPRSDHPIAAKLLEALASFPEPEFGGWELSLCLHIANPALSLFNGLSRVRLANRRHTCPLAPASLMLMESGNLFWASHGRLACQIPCPSTA